MIVVDASVAVKWFLDETGSAAARALLATDAVLLAPHHVLGEIGEVLARARRRGDMSAEGAASVQSSLSEALVLLPLPSLFAAASSIALQAQVSFYDALYVAAAERLGTQVVTADVKLVSRMASTGWHNRVRLLSDGHGEVVR